MDQVEFVEDSFFKKLKEYGLLKRVFDRFYLVYF